MVTLFYNIILFNLLLPLTSSLSCSIDTHHWKNSVCNYARFETPLEVCNVLSEGTGVPTLLNKLSTWKSTRNIDEKISSAMKHPIFTSLTFFFIRWQELECATLGLNTLPATCMPVSAATRMHLPSRSCNSLGKGLTMIQRTAVSRGLAFFPEHPKGLCLLQDKVPLTHLARKPERTDPPHTWHKTLLQAALLYKEDQGWENYKSSLFFFPVSQLVNEGGIFHLGGKRAKGGTVNFSNLHFKIQPLCFWVALQETVSRPNWAYFKVTAGNCQLSILKAQQSFSFFSSF